MNDVLIFLQFWLIIATPNTIAYDQKGLAAIPEIDILSVRQNTSPPIAYHLHQQHGKQHLLKGQNHSFEHLQQRKGLLL